MKRLFSLILFIMLYMHCNICVASSKEDVKHHVIIAIDQAGCDKWIGREDVVNKIVDLLSSDIPDYSQIGRKLYQNGDYFSIVGFGIDATQNDMSLYSLPIKSSTDTYKWLSFPAKELKNDLLDNWHKIAVSKNYTGNQKFSLVSVAKPYAMIALESDNKANRTFLILITDHHYNGNDFYDEIVSLIQKQGELYGSSSLSVDKIFKKCYEVEQNYFIKYLSTDTLRHTRKGFVEFYEYVPLQKNFALSSVMEYPSKVIAHRERKGWFRLEVPLHWRGNKHYKFEEADLFFTNSSEPEYKTPDLFYNITSKDTTLSIRVHEDQIKDNLALRAWITIQDGVYNSTLMSPSKIAPLELGRDGLNVIIPIEKEKAARVLFCSWWIPFFDNQFFAAIVLNVVLGLLAFIVLLLLISLIARPSHYEPDARHFRIGNNDKLNITDYEK